MNIIKKLTPTKRIDYTHYVKFNGEKYIRKETLSLEHYRWEGEDELKDFHTIMWRMFNEKHYQEHGSVEYYSCDNGWAKNGHLNKNNPIPEIEIIFKETVGKDLIYF